MADKDFIVKNGLVVGGDLTTTLVKFNDNDASNWVAFASPATVSSNITWTLPSADAGVSGYALVSNGSGTLSWAAAGATTSSDESTNTDFLIHFDNITSGAVTAVKHDTGLTYNPSTGTLAAATFSGALTGNADTATQLATTRAIQVSGAVTGTANFDGSAAINIVTTNTADPTITLAGDLSGAVTLTNLASGTLTATVGTLNQNTTGSAATLTTARAIQVSGAVTGTANFDGSAAINIVTTATNDPTITLAGDLSGAVTLTNLASGTLTATVGTLNQNTTGSAATLTTARAIALTGAVTGTANFDGSAGISITTTATSDPTLTLAGDLSGTATFTNLGNASLTATVGTLNQNTTGSAATLTTARAIQVSGAVTGTANFDGSAAINIVTTHTADPVITLNGAVTGSGTMTNLGSVTITTTNTADPVLTLAGDATGSATFTNLGNATLTVAVVDDSHNHSSSSGNFTVGGNLVVNGTTVTVNAATITIDDPIITLGGDTTPGADDNKDRGIEFKWHNGTAAKVGFFGFDDSTGYLTFIPDATNTSEVFSGTVGDIQATNFRGALIGNASTATTLQTARTIGGVSFNGSANINLPGVNAAGNQNTTGSAATLTTARTINGVSFNGSANITVADSTKLPTAGGTMTGQIISTRANSTADGSGQIFLNGATGNRIDFAATGVAAPTFTTRSAGTKIVLYPALGAAGADFALGIEGATLWSSVSTTGHQFKWYGGTNLAMTLSGTGILTAPTFSGNGASLTSLNGSNISSGTVAAARVATLNQNTTGSAATLTTARTIGGVSFNGSANINLPGVNAAGNQNTTGSSGSTTGNAATATALQTARTINGVSFNGSANITVADATKLPLTGGAMTGLLVGKNATATTVAAANDAGSFSVRGDSTYPAVMSFHRTGAYAVNFGLSTANNMELGGWSASTIKHTWGMTNGNYTAVGTITGAAFSGSGASLTSLNGSNISSGTVAAARVATLNQNTTGSAATLTTARSIALSGAVTGTATFNGGANITIATTATADPTLTLAGDATGSATFTNLGNATLTVAVVDNSHNHSIDTISDEQRLFNNMGQNHSTQTDFNSITDFGTRFVQGATNGPGTGSSQFYGFSLGLGNEYAFSQYALQLAIPRYIVTDKYLSFRSREGGTWSSWYKINAGQADTLTTARTINGVSFNGSANITVADSTKMPISGGTFTGSVIVPNAFTVGTTTSSDIYMVDTDETTRRIHCNSNRIGFLTSANSWSAYSTNAGLWTCDNGLSVNGSTTISGDNHITFGPNSTWGSSLRIGGNGRTATGTEMASVVTTDGNLHLDAANSTNGIYLNYYTGTGGTLFGNGASAIVATMSSAGNLTINGTATAANMVTNSDIRLKKDIEKITSALEKVKKLNGVNFTKIDNDSRSTGLIAQDVQAVLPEAVSEGDDGYLSVAYGNMVGLLVEAIKEQDSTINSLRNDVETLKDLVNKLMGTK